MSFLDDIMNGIGTAVTAVGNTLNTYMEQTYPPPGSFTQQLTGFVNGISNGITGIANGLTTYVGGGQPATPPPGSTALGTTGAQTQYNATIAAAQGGYAYPGSAYTYNGNNPGVMPTTIPVTANVNLSGFDFNTVYSAVNAAFQNLPSIIQFIQNPMNNPLLAGLLQQITGYFNQQNTINQDLAQMLQFFETTFYQSTSGVLNTLGVNVGDFSSLIDGAVRAGMQALGYSTQQAMDDIKAFVSEGYANQERATEASQANIALLIRSVTDALNRNTDAFNTAVGHAGEFQGSDLPPFIQNAIDSAGAELRKTLQATLDYGLNNPASFFHGLEDRIDSISGVIERLKRGEFTSADAFFQAAFGNDTSAGLARGLIILASVIPTLIKAVGLAGDPALEAFNHLVQEDSPVKLLSPSDYLTSYYKGVITYDQLVDYLKKQGISEENTVILAQAALTDPDMGTMIQARRRGILSDTEWRQYITDQRLDNRSADIITQVANLIPNTQDLTRIADKRIWGLNLPDKYGQYAELPQQYLDYMKQQGFDEQFTRWFWAAHWNLPSPNQIFEMYQRHVINQEDMQAYLALTDWLPFFRDKLLAISYNPLTRVDIRRMYSLGVLSYADLQSRYEAIGFSPADANLMAQFTAKYEGEEGQNEIDKLKKRIITAVERLYVSGKLNFTEAERRLQALGLDAQIANLSLSLLDFEHAVTIETPKLQSYQTRAVSLISAAYLKGRFSHQDALSELMQAGLGQTDAEEELKYLDLEREANTQTNRVEIELTRYVEETYTQAEFISRLGYFGLSAGEINQLVTEGDLRREKKFKLPTEAQVIKWYNAEVINEQYVMDFLRISGYPDSMIPIILAGDFGIGVQ